MGIFDVFRKKKEIQTVKFTELDKWLEEYFEQMGLRERINEFKQSSSDKITEIFAALEKLNNAELMNKNIPPKALHIMEGNRKNYVRQIKYFFENIEMPQNYSEFKEFSEHFSERLDELSNQTQKNYFVLKEFLSHEAYEVVRRVKELENDTLKLMREFDKKNVDTITTIRTRLEEFRRTEQVIKELEETKQKELHSIDGLKEKQEKIKQRLSLHKRSERFTEFKTLTAKEQEIEEKLKKERNEFLGTFLELEKALKKYKRQSLDEKLLDQYLEDAVYALTHDTDLKIVETLQKMKHTLAELNLKDKQLQKMEQNIDRLDTKYLGEKRKALMAMDIELKSVRSEKLQNTVCLNITEQESLLKSTLNNISEKYASVEELDNKLERLNLNLIKQDIGQKLQQLGAVLEK